MRLPTYDERGNRNDPAALDILRSRKQVLQPSTPASAPAMPDTTERPRTGWDHEAMRD